MNAKTNKPVKLSSRQSFKLSQHISSGFRDGKINCWTDSSMFNETGVYRTKFVLEEKGLIKITFSPDDKNSYTSEITAAGVEWLRANGLL